MSDSFFSRWSRRKQAQASSLPEPSAQPVQAGQASARPAEAAAAPSEAAAVPSAQDLPTLQDARALTPESDFQPFMRRGVGTEVRNAAMKKLFADPHFNVMDGLDIYIGDYSQPDPMPAGMLGQMASAQFLKLVPETGQGPERPAQNPEADTALLPVHQVVAQSPDSLASAEPLQHDHPDLQLQPDPAPSEPDPEPRAR